MISPFLWSSVSSLLKWDKSHLSEKAIQVQWDKCAECLTQSLVTGEGSVISRASHSESFFVWSIENISQDLKQIKNNDNKENYIPIG